MPIHRLLQKHMPMEPEEISRLTTAYEQALRGIGLVDRNDPLSEMVAKRVIRYRAKWRARSHRHCCPSNRRTWCEDNLNKYSENAERKSPTGLSRLPDIGVGFPVLGRDVMRNSVDIDPVHSRAIAKKIGERLRASFKEDRELPATFQKQIERLRQSESEAQAQLARTRLIKA